MTPEQIDEAGTRPGADGTLWRLVKHWNPNGISVWFSNEMLRNTPGPDCARAMAELMAGATFGFGMGCDDVREAVVGPQGVVQAYQRSLQAKVSRHLAKKTPGGVFLPDLGVFNGGGHG